MREDGRWNGPRRMGEVEKEDARRRPGGVYKQAWEPERAPADPALFLIALANNADEERGWRGAVDGMQKEGGSAEALRIYQRLDSSKLSVTSTEGARVILRGWGVLSGEESPFPYALLFRKWNNQRAQVQLINALVLLPSEATQLHTSSQITLLIERDKMLFNNGREVRDLLESNYNCLEIFRLASELDPEHADELIRQCANENPELCCLGLMHIYPAYDQTFREMFLTVMNRSPESKIVMSSLFEKNKRLTFHMLSKMYPSLCSLEHCLEICLDSKMFPYIVEKVDPMGFSLDLIILAARREIIDLGGILNVQSNEDFLNTLLQYILSKYGKGSQRGMEIYPLTIEMIIMICMSLDMMAKMVPKTTLAYLTKLKSLLVPEVRTCIVRRVTLRQQAKEFLHNVIGGRIVNSDAVVYITQLSGNKSVYDTELLESIISELINRYAFVEQMSAHDLMSMALFYGRMVKYELLPPADIKRVMELVLDALRAEPDSNKFRFGIKTLETFCDILDRYPLYCQEVSRVGKIYSLNRALYAYIRDHLSIQPLYLKDAGKKGTLSFQDFVSMQFSKGEARPSWPKLFNMLTQMNTHKIVEDAQKDVAKDVEAFAEYLVEKRILREANNLKLYVDFVALFSEELESMVRAKISMLVKAFRAAHSEIEKSERDGGMRILGSVLGMFVFLRSRPLLRKELDVREHLIGSVQGGCVYATVLFSCKYLENCVGNSVMGQKSPYVKRILEVLSEIHFLLEESDQMALEIEICFKKLGMSVEDVVPGSAIQERRVSIRKRNTGLAKYTGLEGLRAVVAHVVVMAVDFAVREVTSSIVERVFVISTRSAMEIGKRDFSCFDEESAQAAFKGLVMNLATSLAEASTAGPLRAGVINNIGHFLKISGMDCVSEEKIRSIAESNAETCTLLIRKAVRDRVSSCLDSLYQELGREIERSGKKVQPVSGYRIWLFVDKGEEEAGEGDASRPSDCEAEEAIVAERIPPITVGEYHEIRAHLSSINYKQKGGEALESFTGSSAQKKWEDLQRIFREVERGGEEGDVDMEKREIELLEALRTVVSFAMASDKQDVACLFFCQNMIGSMFIFKSDWVRQETIHTVKKLCSISQETAYEVSSWLIYAEDERKFNPRVMAQLIDSGLINRTEYDIYLGNMIEMNSRHVKYAVELLNECLVSPVPIGSPFDFVCTIEEISKSVQTSPDRKAQEMLKTISKKIVSTKKEGADGEVFEEWVAKKYCTMGEVGTDGILARIEAMDSQAFRGFLHASIRSVNEGYLRQRKEHSPAAYFKAEALGSLLASLKRQELVEALEIVVEVFLGSLVSGCFFFQKVLTRMLLSLLDTLSPEMDDIVFDFLEKLRPADAPFFAGGYLEILFNKYVRANMFLRNEERGVKLILWSYEYLEGMDPCEERDRAVYVCSRFVEELRRFVPSFYARYSLLCLLASPLFAVGLRNMWSLSRSPVAIDEVKSVPKSGYSLVFERVYRVVEKRERHSLLSLENTPADKMDHLVVAIVENLTNENEISMFAREMLLGMFLRKEEMREIILFRLLERICLFKPHPLYLRKTLETLLNSEAYMEALGEVVKKDRAIVGRLVMHASNILLDETAQG
jgi:CCR4-NOT transcription complex subunit 1 CAF1-binding domain/CCR4-NOT transcription complex subunit 1 TTP binding domain/Domain of unknown function (DUF3819)/CCR4-NOT transcription complex subunit 1 HEAT repeat